MANEKRLIDANKLKNRFNLRLNWLKLDVHDEYTKGLYHGCDYDITLIDEQPTVDAVEVVRCKDCKHYIEESLTCIPKLTLAFEHPNYYPDDFCSYGERKDNES